jgi:hypothetical protein
MAPIPPFSTVGGYGGNPSLIVDPNTGQSAAFADTQDGFPTLHPQIGASGALTPVVVDPMQPPLFYSGMPEINAILCELRVISALLHIQLGATPLDLQIMRADEAWNTSINTGVL